MHSAREIQFTTLLVYIGTSRGKASQNTSRLARGIFQSHRVSSRMTCGNSSNHAGSSHLTRKKTTTTTSQFICITRGKSLNASRTHRGECRMNTLRIPRRKSPYIPRIARGSHRIPLATLQEVDKYLTHLLAARPVSLSKTATGPASIQ